VTQLVSWGFIRDPEKISSHHHADATYFSFLLLICVAALATAVLNSCGKFFVPAVSPSGLSIAGNNFHSVYGSAICILLPIQSLAIAAVVGVGIHLAWQMPSLYKEVQTEICPALCPYRK